MTGKLQYVYFIGIGGIGMSALARYFRAAGLKVSGYDRTPTALTEALVSEGIDVHFRDDIGLVNADLLRQPEKTLVVITPAVPKDHTERAYFLSHGFQVRKRSEVLGMLTQDRFTIAVAGTHGKTTTSTMIAHLLHAGGVDCTAFLGGVSKNYESNLLLPANPARAPVVVEADEYDRSFLTLHPDIAVVTSMDADHLDIYGDAASMQQSYRMFAAQLKTGGTLLYKEGLSLQPAGRSATYGLRNSCVYHAANIRIEQHRFIFDWLAPEESIEGLASDMPGRHNVENAVAAVAVARLMQVPPERVKEALSSFRGVRRRFEYVLRSPSLVYIDDYAHHPEELRACIGAARELYPGMHLTGIFQPHLFSRTRDFADGFAKSLSMLDELLIMDIYPARELPIEGVTSHLILDRVKGPGKMLCTPEQVLQRLAQKRNGVVLTLGAGDIDKLVKPIRALLEKNVTSSQP